MVRAVVVIAMSLILHAAPASAQPFPNYIAQVQRAIDELHLGWEQCRHPDGTPEDNRVDEVCPGRNLIDLDNQMKGTVGLRAAYYIHQLDPAFGLLEKTGGNNIKGYSTDVIIHSPDGWYVDILTTGLGADGLRHPLARWDFRPPDADTHVSRWRVPTAELAGLNAPPPVVTPPPVVIPPPVTPPPVTPIPVITDDDVMERAILALLTEHDRRAEEHWKEAKGIWETTMKPFFTFVGKWVLPAVGAFFAGKAYAD